MLRLLFIATLVLSFFYGLRGQRVNTEFGKNRVQYHDDFKYWNVYESENFITYWYGKSQNVAQAAVGFAEYDHEEIVNVLEYSLRDKIEMVVFLDVSDLQQSNLGLDEELFNNTGKTQLIGNKLFVYFQGDYQALRSQVREGIAAVYLNAILFGSSLQDRVENVISLDLPIWYKQGLIQYVGSPWGFESEQKLQNYLSTAENPNFEDLSESHPILAGHSFWYFISQKYGNTAIANIIYRIRTSKNIRSGFFHVLNQDLELLAEAWLEYYQNKYDLLPPATEMQRLLSSSFEKPRLQSICASDRGHLAYVSNDMGKLRVFLKNPGDDKFSKIWSRGQRAAMIETDRNYPLIDFTPDGRHLLIIYEYRDVIYYRQINTSTLEFREGFFPQSIQRVYDLSFYDRAYFLLSVQIDGYADLIRYTPKNRQYTRLTSDYHADRAPQVGILNGQKGIFFSSNRKGYIKEAERLRKTLPLNHYDLYFLSEEPQRLYQISNTPLINETQPIVRDSHLYFLSDALGAKQVFRIALEDLEFEENLFVSDKSEIPSFENLDYSGDQQELISAHHQITLDYALPSSLIQLTEGYDGYAIVESEASDNARVALETSPFRPIYNLWAESDYEDNTEYLDKLEKVEETAETVDAADTEKAPRDTVVFMTRFPDFPKSIIDKRADEKQMEMKNLPVYDIDRPLHSFNPVRAKAYNTSFGIDDLSLRLNNELLFGGLNTFAGLNEEFEVQQAGILLSGQISDIFDDYRIDGGARFRTDFRGSEYFLSFSDRSRLIDRKYSVYRRSQLFNTSLSFAEQRRERETNFIMTAEFRYPFGFFTSLRATGTLRSDKIAPLSLEDQSLKQDPATAQRIGLRLEYVYDNTLQIDINQLRGSRAKAYAEILKRFDLGLSGGSSFSLDDGFMTIVGFDARHYQGFLKHSVLALRVTGATSFGSEKILFHAGAVENWLFNSFDNSIPIPAGENFAYRTTVSNLRGFEYNVRNGNSFALLNAEVRIPVMKYFSRNRLRSTFLRTFQLVGFFDTGSAWLGLNPLDEENPQYTLALGDDQGIVQVEARYFRQPFVYGYGFGVRTLLLGYHIGVDYGWGVDSGIRNDGRLHIGLGLDF